MPLPLALGRFNLRVTNRVLWPIVGRVPGFGRVVHVGRRSGRSHRTPMLLFRSGDRAVFALTYGPDAQWVQNVRAAGSCRFEDGGSVLDLAVVELVHDPSRGLVPRPVRWALAVLRVDDFLVLRVTGEGGRVGLGGPVPRGRSEVGRRSGPSGHGPGDGPSSRSLLLRFVRA